MAAADRYEEKQLVYRYGHGIQMFKQLRNFAGTLPHLFEQEFTLPCQDNPSSWSIRVELRKEPDDGRVSSDIVIKRTDSREISFNTYFCIGVGLGWLPDILDKKETGENFCIPSSKHTARGMSPGVEARRTVDRLMTNGVLKRFCSLSAQLRIFFLVSGCHKGETGPMTEKEKSFSKM